VQRPQPPPLTTVIRDELVCAHPIILRLRNFDRTCAALSNLFYLWQKQLFENGTAAFANTGKRRQADQDAKDRQIAALEDRLRTKNDVLAELMEEHVQLKKELGEP
jgi:hypothetical protein